MGIILLWRATLVGSISHWLRYQDDTLSQLCTAEQSAAAISLSGMGCCFLFLLPALEIVHVQAAPSKGADPCMLLLHGS